MATHAAERLPSGRQIEIHHGDQTAVVTEVGAGLRTYRAGGLDVLDGYGAWERCSGGRGQLLLPWPNRLRDGRYTFAGRPQQLPLTEPEQGHAIHGLTRWVSWTVREAAPDRCALACLVHPQPGYPFTLWLEARYHLDDSGLHVLVRATNQGRDALPYAAGAHPYLRLDDGGLDTWQLRVPARATLEMDARAIPTGRLLPVAGTPVDFTELRPIGRVRLDTCFTELDRDPDGLARVVLAGGSPRRQVTLWVPEDQPYLMVFTGDTLAEEGRRRRGLAVEPMTAAPNAFQNGLGLRTLAPGEEVRTRWGITPG